MSYTEIFKFNQKGNPELIGEIKNAHRGAMAVWNKLAEKYNVRFSLFDMQPVWDLQKSKKITRNDKICLVSTFDNVIIYKKDLPELIEAYKSFNPETSLTEQALLIENLLKNDTDLIAIAFNQTSVNGDNWCNFGGYDEETEESLPYNILNQNDRHWDLFSDL